MKNFEGMETNIPGVYNKSEYPPQGGIIGAPTSEVVVLGVTKGGIPYNAADYDENDRINSFTSPNQMLKELIGGPAYYTAEFYLTPTKDPNLNTPSRVKVVGVNPSSRATGTLKDAATNDIVDIKSRRYGALANQIARKVEAGTTRGYKATVKFKGNVVGQKDNIALDFLSIQYTGSGSAATMSISGTQLTTVCTGATGDNLTINFSDFPKLGDLVEYINSQDAYTCSLKGRSDYLSNTMDKVTTQDVKTSVYNAMGNVEALIQFLNKECQGEIIAALHASADRAAIVADSGFVFLTSGSDGSATNSDWASALELLEKMGVNHVLAASGDAAVAALVDAHVNRMSQMEQKKNRSAGGGASSTTNTKSARIAEMKALNSARYSYGCTPFYRYDAPNGNIKTEFEPFYLAAMVAGIRFGNHLTTSSVFQTLNILGVAEKYSLDDKKDYLSAGGILVEEDADGFAVVDELSTFQGGNLILENPSALRTCDHITLDSQVKIKARLKALKKAPNAIAIKEIQNFLITNLLPGYVRDGLLTEDPQSGEPAFCDIEFDIRGDAFYFNFTGIIPLPLKFVFIKQKFVVIGQNR